MVGDSKRVAGLLFCLLSRQTSDGTIVRNPITVREAVETARVSADDILNVAKIFAQDGRDFITISPDNRDPDLESTLDISHESLLRNWARLRAWIEAEADSAKDFNWIMEAASRWGERRGSLFTGSNLRYALAWAQKAKPSLNWCARYGGDFDLMKSFLRKSSRMYWTKRLLVLAAISTLVAASVEQYVKYRAEAVKNRAAAVGASQELFRIADGYFRNPSDPRRNVLSLSTASRAIAIDNANFEAVKLACNLMLGKFWCPPLTQPLRYPSTDFITGTVVREDNQNRIFTVSSDGWLFRFSGTNTKPDSILRLLDAKDGFHPRILGASFSHNAHELIVIQSSQAPAAVQARLWSRHGLTYIAEDGFSVPDYSPFGTLTWSGDDRFFVFLPSRFDQPSVCRAFRVDGNVATPIAHPFADLPLTRVAFSSDNLVATLTGETWLWQLARAVSGNVGATSSANGGFATMSEVRQKFEDVKNTSPHCQTVWNHFFGVQ
jgi:hypothetical protein